LPFRRNFIVIHLRFNDLSRRVRLNHPLDGRQA
jgi:hypothetical protein